MHWMRLVAALAAAVGLCDLANADAQSAKAAFDNIVRPLVSADVFSGCILAASGDEVIYQNAAGLGDVGRQIPIANDTPFRIASITKGFTAVLVLQAAQRKELSLDAPLSECLPELASSAFAQATIRHMLTHTSGIPDFGPEPAAGQSVREALVERLKTTLPATAPGSERKYCNVGYTLLGIILEQAAGQSFADLAKTRIFVPTGMHRSYVESWPLQPGARALGYARERGQWTPREIDADPAVFAGAGAIVSTASDLLRFSRALSGNVLLEPAARAAMFDPESPLGCKVQRLPLLGTLHVFEGDMTGASALLIRSDDGARTLVLLSNRGDAPLQRMALPMFMNLPR